MVRLDGEGLNINVYYEGVSLEVIKQFYILIMVMLHKSTCDEISYNY